ncbi:MAG: GNAT family N-acetyltransferase [Bacteroidetes bacterium]|nr:GNAT family N-acetyltransferase [Bacteroidota bacterium]HET6242928.1 GNAT family N-acetyltransferase [Bacteroidia bacterium]
MELFDFKFKLFSTEIDISEFDCKDADINAFLRDDALNYQRQLMANTYVFTKGETGKEKVVAFFCISNDCLNDLYDNSAFNKLHRKIKLPNEKRIRQYPAVKVGRLGVDNKYHGTGISYQLMDFIKGYSIMDSKPACRLLLLDAYNKPKQLSFYAKNGFEFLLSTGVEDKTRIMYFDLLTLH